MEDPQAQINEYIMDFEHPVLGPIKAVGLPAKFSKTPGGITREAPELGQHTEEILLEVLGASWEEIGELREQEVI